MSDKILPGLQTSKLGLITKDLNSFTDTFGNSHN
jgi:hypothetical protein